MIFSKLHLENWRNFASVDVSLQQRMFLIGANATGKSNLLDVFRFLHDIVRVGGGFEKAIVDRGGVVSLRNLFVHDMPDIIIDVSLQNGGSEVWRYRLAFSADQLRPIVVEEKAWKDGVALLDRPDEQDRTDEELLYQTRLEQSSANRKFRVIANFFNSISYYHIVPQIVREPERSAGRIEDPYGGDFLEQMVRLPAKVRDNRLARIEQILRSMVPQFHDLEIAHSEGIPHLLGRFGPIVAGDNWKKRIEQTLRAEADFSDGTLRLIGLLWALLDGNGPLLLEEPELSLHAAVVRRLPGLMWSIQQENQRQVLVSTHSDDLLQNEGIAADEVLILQPASNGTSVQLGAEIEVIRQLMEAGLPAAEAALPSTDPPDIGQLAVVKNDVE